MNRKPKILVVGSFVMDQIVNTEIFPREGQTILGKSFRKAPGGKGANQAVQVARLGADVTMFGKLGHDGNGKELIAACKEAGINIEHIVYDDVLASGCAVIILEDHPGQSTQNRIIVIPGSNMAINPEDVAFLKEGIAAYDLVMLQLEIPIEINELVAQYAFEKGVPVMLNSAPSTKLSDKFLACLSYISPNKHEVEDLTGIHIEQDGRDANMDAVKEAAKFLNDKGVKNVLITLGSAGAALLTEDGFHYSHCVNDIVAVDPTAAGDSFVGTFCTGICSGWSWDDCLVFANHAAALTVSTIGAMPSLPTLEQVEAFLQKRGVSVPDTSILKLGR